MLARMGSFDVALLEALVSAGVSPERARAVVELFDRSIDERYSLHAQILATKRDVAELQAALSRDLSEVQARLARDLAEVQTRLSRDVVEGQTRLSREIADTKVDIAATKVDIAATKADLVKWVVGALTAQTALLLGAVKLF